MSQTLQQKTIPGIILSVEVVKKTDCHNMWLVRKETSSHKLWLDITMWI